MSETVIMPKLGLTMSEGIVAKWLKSVGDAVLPGEAIAEIETDKITMTLESPCDGFIITILVQEEETVPILTPLCIIGEREE